MKLIHFFIFFMLMLFIASCNKDNSNSVIIYEAGSQEFGWAKGTKKGLDWEASAYWQYHQEDSTFWGISFVTYSSYGAQRESFSLNEIPFSIETFPVKGGISNLGDGFVGGGLGMFTDDGDAAILNGFKVNEDENSYITISEIDTLTKTIKGFFEIYFISESIESKVEIKDGEFEVRPYE